MTRTRASRNKSVPNESIQLSASTSTNQRRSSSPDECPACKGQSVVTPVKAREKRLWVECEGCEKWFHWECVGGDGDLSLIDKWYCVDCLEATPDFVITFKPPARKSSRPTQKRDYANLHSGVESGDANRWMQLIQGKTIKKDQFRRMKGSEVTLEWLDKEDTALTEPIVVLSPEGLGMKMPAKSFTVQDVVNSVGLDVPVEVMDVATQSNSTGWTLGSWAEYYSTPMESRDKIRNVISLEISDTKLAQKVVPPRLVRDLDWVEKFWPSNKKGDTQYPKVQLYCLMSVAHCWTDWHVDFAGSSVYYHILRGSKIFYFVRPTSNNLSAYEKWSGSELQSSTWLGDTVDEVIKVELTEGNTMIIPTGWIHAVYTPMDSLVFGGNFLHSYNIATQLRVREIEISTRVPKKFRFPMFERLSWYVAERYLRDLKNKEEFPSRVLQGLDALASFLVAEARVLEHGSDTLRKEAKDHIPGDKIKDPSALIRELRWRVRLAAGGESGDELDIDILGKESPKGAVGPSKRKRAVEAEEESIGRPRKRKPRFRNFEPRPWNETESRPLRTELTRRRVPNMPGLTDGIEWLDDRDKDDPLDARETRVEVEIHGSVDEVVRLRRAVRDGTVMALEREVIRRTMEVWTFEDYVADSNGNGNGKVASEGGRSSTGSPSTKDEIDMD